MDLGANPNALDGDQANALHYLAITELRESEGLEAIRIEQTLERLLAAGINPSTENKHGQTPLMLARAQGNFRMAAMLQQLTLDASLPPGKPKTTGPRL